MLSKLPLLGLFLLVDHSLGSCGTCQSNYVACHSESTFSLCIDGKPSTDSTIACPVDTVCTTEPRICVSKLDNSVWPTCITACGVCNSFQKVFACISPNTYAFCFGEEYPFYATTGTCLDGYVCDLSSRTICVKDTDSKPSCNEDFTMFTTTHNLPVTSSPAEGSFSTTRDPSWTDPSDGATTLNPPATDSPGIESSSTTAASISPSPAGETSSSTRDPSEDDSTTAITEETTTRTPRDAATFCAEAALPGTYKAEGDSTCTKFYMCLEDSGIYSGMEYTCINSGFFNSATRECEKKRPDDC